MPAHYIPNETYAALIDGLAAAHEAHDPRTRIIELVGEYANVWPEDVLEDDDAETSTEEQYAALSNNEQLRRTLNQQVEHMRREARETKEREAGKLKDRVSTAGSLDLSSIAASFGLNVKEGPAD